MTLKGNLGSNVERRLILASAVGIWHDPAGHFDSVCERTKFGHNRSDAR